MEIRMLPLGQLQTNCYLVWGENTDKCVVIDPGDEAEILLTQLARLGKTPEAVFLTHCHFDHIRGVKDLVAERTCPVYICKEDLTLPEAMTAGSIYYTHTYKEGDSLSMAGLTFTVLHTPGHTPGSVCLRCEDVLFTGDTLFAGSCGRTDFPGSSPAQMRTSLNRLRDLGGNFAVLSGHGPNSTLDEERRSNPFL